MGAVKDIRTRKNTGTKRSQTNLNNLPEHKDRQK